MIQPNSIAAAASHLQWFELADVQKQTSPALLVFRDRVEQNAHRMLKITGGPERLRPHIKTHKMREVVELQRRLGVTKFKCATVAEAEMAASAGVEDLLLAYQPVGPCVRRVVELVKSFPATKFSGICDDADAIRELSSGMERFMSASGEHLSVLLDVDVGQHRTGISVGEQALQLYRLIASSPGLKPGGLHVYDGHLSGNDPVERKKACDLAFEEIAAFKNKLLNAGLSVPRVVAGGTPTFPFHAARGDVECSPGTCIFWDEGYASKLADLPFVPAALVLTRIISKPGAHLLCLDLGHKAIASEMPHPRVLFIGLEDAKAVLHSEEHLVVESARAAQYKVGDCLYGIPWHICPTVALYSEAALIEDHQVVANWKIARDRRVRI